LNVGHSAAQETTKCVVFHQQQRHGGRRTPSLLLVVGHQQRCSLAIKIKIKIKAALAAPAIANAFFHRPRIFFFIQFDSLKKEIPNRAKLFKLMFFARE
jgi:hypothetical protein